MPSWNTIPFNTAKSFPLEKAEAPPLVLRLGVLVHHMEGVVVPVFRVEAVDGKASPQAVAPLVHDGDGPDGPLPGEALPRGVHDPKEGAGGHNLVIAVGGIAVDGLFHRINSVLFSHG